MRFPFGVGANGVLVGCRSVKQHAQDLMFGQETLIIQGKSSSASYIERAATPVWSASLVIPGHFLRATVQAAHATWGASPHWRKMLYGELIESSPCALLLPNPSPVQAGTGEIMNAVAHSPLTRKLSAFVALSEAELAALERLHHRRRSFVAGQDLVHQGQSDQAAYILSEGWVCSYKTGRRIAPDCRFPDAW